MSTGTQASRRDPSTDIIEEVAYFGDPPRMLGWTHIPPGDVLGGVVVCSSTHAELLKAYHVEVQLARELAAKGIAVQRFHYRGDGNSEGSPADLTLTTMVADAMEAQERLTERLAIDRLSFVGVRLGAFPATALSEMTPGSSLVLWDPVRDADTFFQEAIRSHAISAIKGEGRPESVEEALQRLEAEGSIELLGYEITSAFHKSMAGKTLVNLTPKGGSVFLVPFGSTDLTSLAEGWSEKGVEVTHFDGTAREAWWLDEQASVDRHQRSSVLVLGSAAWLRGQLADH